MQENINYAGDIFYEIELAEDFEVAEDDDIYSFSISCNKTTLLCCWCNIRIERGWIVW